jgi:hypothetical protein
MAAKLRGERTGKDSSGRVAGREAGMKTALQPSMGLSYLADPAMRALIDALPMSVVTIDPAGYISLANKAWLRYGSDRDLKDMNSISAGANYLEVCRLAARSGDQIASKTLDGLDAILNGRSSMDFHSDQMGNQRVGEPTPLQISVSILQ